MASTLSKQGTASFFNDPTFSDATIKFSDRTIFAHRTILSNKSEYFYRAFTGKFKESESGIIDLGSDEDPKVIDMMLRHIYGALSSRTVNTADELATEVLLFAAADKYDVPTLRLATTDFTLGSLSDILRKEDITQGFCDVIAAIYAHVGDTSLQDKVSTFCHQNIETMMESEEFVKMLPNVGRLCFELFTKSRNANKTAAGAARIKPFPGSVISAYEARLAEMIHKSPSHSSISFPTTRSMASGYPPPPPPSSPSPAPDASGIRASNDMSNAARSSRLRAHIEASKATPAKRGRGRGQGMRRGGPST